MSDAWDDLQAFQQKRSSFKERLQKRKKEREDILSGNLLTSSPSPGTSTADDVAEKFDPNVERHLLVCLCDVAVTESTNSQNLTTLVEKKLGRQVSHARIKNLLHKFSAQELISLQETMKNNQSMLTVTTVEHSRLTAMADEAQHLHTKDGSDVKRKNTQSSGQVENISNIEPAEKTPKIENKEKHDKKLSHQYDIMSLLSLTSIKEKENKKMGAEIYELLSKPTVKEKSLAERFRSQGGAQVKEFCPHGTKDECKRATGTTQPCTKLHFRKIIQKHTDESLGDCSFLNTCFHMDTCKYVHYEVDYSGSSSLKDQLKSESKESPSLASKDMTILYPPQWVQCDLRYFDMTCLGKFAVIMADPPWDIHMELPYGTMSDDEMRQLNVPALQDDGLLFLWVTGRAMELGRECLQLWGYDQVDEVIWVKTNQLQRIIRTGRTGHWLNHGKEHCLVGKKGNLETLNRGLDCDVIVAEVRATSHKPDEIYGIIERLSPGTRKIELFGRPHNVQPNWITLGNQVDGVWLVDPEMIATFEKRYPDGNCMVPPKS